MIFRSTPEDVLHSEQLTHTRGSASLRAVEDPLHSEQLTPSWFAPMKTSYTESLAQIPSDLSQCAEQTLGVTTATNPITPRGSWTPKSSNIPKTIEEAGLPGGLTPPGS